MTGTEFGIIGRRPAQSSALFSSKAPGKSSLPVLNMAAKSLGLWLRSKPVNSAVEASRSRLPSLE